MIGGLTIRDERPGDKDTIRAVVEAAFARMPYADGDEHLLVDRLRQMNGLSLSLVAERAGEIIGHIAFSPARVGGKEGPWFQLAPVSVRPDRQRQGIGSALIEAGIARLRALNAELCLVMGHAAYYPRFGFESVAEISDTYPDRNPHFMRLVLAGSPPEGAVTYHAAFAPQAH